MTERKLESAENNIKKLNDEKAQLEALKQEQANRKAIARALAYSFFHGVYGT